MSRARYSTLLYSFPTLEASSQALIARKTGPGHNGYSQAFPKLMALHLAAYFGVKVIVQLLLEQGANFSATDSYRQTPLSCGMTPGREI
jgi:ankyrin repeat protein